MIKDSFTNEEDEILMSTCFHIVLKSRHEFLDEIINHFKSESKNPLMVDALEKLLKVSLSFKEETNIEKVTLLQIKRFKKEKTEVGNCLAALLKIALDDYNEYVIIDDVLKHKDSLMEKELFSFDEEGILVNLSIGVIAQVPHKKLVKEIDAEKKKTTSESLLDALEELKLASLVFSKEKDLMMAFSSEVFRLREKNTEVSNFVAELLNFALLECLGASLAN
jgi:hypothetical protein